LVTFLFKSSVFSIEIFLFLNFLSEDGRKEVIGG